MAPQWGAFTRQNPSLHSWRPFIIKLRYWFLKVQHGSPRSQSNKGLLRPVSGQVKVSWRLLLWGQHTGTVWEVYRSARSFNRRCAGLLCSAQGLSKFDNSGEMAANVSGRCTMPVALTDLLWESGAAMAISILELSAHGPEAQRGCQKVPPWLQWLQAEWLDFKKPRRVGRRVDLVTFYIQPENIQEQRFRLLCQFYFLMERRLSC